MLIILNSQSVRTSIKWGCVFRWTYQCAQINMNNLIFAWIYKACFYVFSFVLAVLLFSMNAGCAVWYADRARSRVVGLCFSDFDFPLISTLIASLQLFPFPLLVSSRCEAASVLLCVSVDAASPLLRSVAMQSGLEAAPAAFCVFRQPPNFRAQSRLHDPHWTQQTSIYQSVWNKDCLGSPQALVTFKPTLKWYKNKDGLCCPAGTSIIQTCTGMIVFFSLMGKFEGSCPVP